MSLQHFNAHHYTTDAENLNQPSWFQRQCQQWVLATLKHMNKGHLVMTLPDNRVVEVGTANQQSSVYVQVHHWDFFKRAVLYGHIGFSEAYMAGEWSSPDLEAVFSWVIDNLERAAFLEGSIAQSIAFNALGLVNKMVHWMRPNTKAKSQSNIQSHYDLSNAFFQTFLDSSMTYSCAWFETLDLKNPMVTNLEAAQHAKIQRICERLRLKPGEHVLEIGSGWGALACAMAEHYGCKVTTITLSKQQHAYVQQLITDRALTGQVDVRLTDYRDLKGQQFDKIVSVEMIEAVGDKFYETFFRQCDQLLKPDGLLVMQMILAPDHRYATLKRNVDFIQKHIFPGSLVPSLQRLHQALNRVSNLGLFELHDMGLHYAQTLRMWDQRFHQALPTIQEQGFDANFIRKWHYYFMYCAAAFAMRHLTVAQGVYTRSNNPTLMTTP